MFMATSTNTVEHREAREPDQHQRPHRRDADDRQRHRARGHVRDEDASRAETHDLTRDQCAPEQPGRAGHRQEQAEVVEADADGRTDLWQTGHERGEERPVHRELRTDGQKRASVAFRPRRRSWHGRPTLGRRGGLPRRVVTLHAMASTRTERRQHDRSAVELAATIERISGRPLSGPATTVDLSLGGARVVAPGGFGVGDVVRLALTSGDLSIEHQALVVGRQDESRSSVTLNLAFKSLDDRSAEVLRRVLDMT
jgi:hypothetical protein